MGRTRGSFQQSSSRGPPLPEGTQSIEMKPPYPSPVSTAASQRESLTQGIGLGISTRGMDTSFNHPRACHTAGRYSMAPPLHNQLVPSGAIYFNNLLDIGRLSNDPFREVYNSCPTTSDSPISLYSAQTLSASPSYNSAMELPSNQEPFSNQPPGLWGTTPCSRTTTANEVVAADDEAKSHWCRNLFADRLVPTSASMPSAANSSFSPTTFGETDSRQMVTEPQGPAAKNAATSPSNSSRRSRFSSPADKPSEVDLGLKCPICGAKFTRKSNCREHQKKHDPEFKKMFTCDTCGRSFRRGTDLRRHADSIHKGIKRFPCKICGKRYSRSDTLARHIAADCEGPSTASGTSRQVETIQHTPSSLQPFWKLQDRSSKSQRSFN